MCSFFCSGWISTVIYRNLFPEQCQRYSEQDRLHNDISCLCLHHIGYFPTDQSKKKRSLLCHGYRVGGKSWALWNWNLIDYKIGIMFSSSKHVILNSVFVDWRNSEETPLFSQSYNCGQDLNFNLPSAHPRSTEGGLFEFVVKRVHIPSPTSAKWFGYFLYSM